MGIDFPQSEIGSDRCRKGKVDQIGITIMDAIYHGLITLLIKIHGDGLGRKMLQRGDAGTIMNLMPMASDLIPQSDREGICGIDLSPTLIEADEKKEGLSGCTQCIHVADPRHG